jgi:hypothetical protein
MYLNLLNINQNKKKYLKLNFFFYFNNILIYYIVNNLFPLINKIK